MSKNMQRVRDSLPMIDTAKRFVCFASVWWSGAGLDAAIWWEDDQGFHRLVLGTGETQEPTEARLLATRKITAEDFESVVSDGQKLGFGELPDQERPIRLTHFSDWYGIKARDDAPKWTFIAGGKHGDARADRWNDWVEQHCPELLPV